MKALPFLHQYDRVATKASDMSQLKQERGLKQAYYVLCALTNFKTLKTTW